MPQDNTTTPVRVWYASAHASLSVLGSYLRRTGFFAPLGAYVQIQQKTLKYTPVQKLEMFLVALLAGAKAVSQTNLTDAELMLPSARPFACPAVPTSR